MLHHSHQAHSQEIRRCMMEYSADDLAAARTLQYLGYICMSTVVFWIYDYACSLQEEWTFLLRSRWTKIKGLYTITRYLPFFLITMDLYLKFTPNENPNKCLMLIDIYSCFGMMSLTCSESFFVFRTCALWNNNRIVLVGMLSTLFAIFVASMGTGLISTSYITISAIPGITGCYRSMPNVQFFIPFLLLFVFQLGLVSLTLIRVMQNWRSAKGPLHAVLVKHNVFYYACGLFLSAVNILVPMLSPDAAYYSIFERLEVVILAILATRMHLHLWHMDQHTDSSDILVQISLSDVSHVDRTV